MNVLYQGFRFIIVRLTQKNQHFLPEFLFFRSTAQAYFKVIGPIYSNLWISTFLSFWLFYCLLYQSQCCPTLLWTYYSKNKTCSLSPFSVSSVRKLIKFCAHRGEKNFFHVLSWNIKFQNDVWRCAWVWEGILLCNENKGFQFNFNSIFFCNVGLKW